MAAITVLMLSASGAVLPQQPVAPLAPTPATSPTHQAVAGQSLADLQARIRLRLADTSVRRGSVGIKVVSLNTGKVLFENDSERYFMPASNMKNFTVAAALEKLTPDYRFVTRVLAGGKPVGDGIIKGDLYVRGSGDVSASYGFFDGDNFRGIERVVDALIAAGVKGVDGGIVGDDSYFRGPALPTGWEWDDLQWYYGAEVSALPINDNAISLTVKPSSVGYQCAAKMTPFNLVMRFQNRCVTTAAGTERTLRIEKKIGENLIEITGNLPLGDRGFSNNVTISRPAEFFASMLKQRLAEKGITVKGRARAITPGIGPDTAPDVEIARIESPPLSLIAAKTMKPSQNMYTEVLLWTLGENLRAGLIQNAEPLTDRRRDSATSSELGIDTVRSFLKQIGVDDDAVKQYDGSGLSRHNIVTPAAVVQLYTYMGKQSRFSQAWRSSLTVAGVDGTLRNRFKETRGSSNVRGKTGTIDQVSALSGYVTSAAGEELVFSMIINGVPEGRTRVALIDDVVLMLANFGGRVD